MVTQDKDSLLDAPSVEAWIEQHEPAGVEKLHNAVTEGVVKSPRARSFVLRYLLSRDDAPMSAEEARAVVRDNRARKAVKRALKWAIAAVVLGGATLLLSTWLVWKG